MIRREAIAAAVVIFNAGAVEPVEARPGSTLDAAAYFPAILRQSDPAPTPMTLTPTPQPTATPTATRPPGCHPSYPTVCIPPPPPDLNCPDVRHLVNFQVVPPDPHGFDADHDGIGCEAP